MKKTILIFFLALSIGSAIIAQSSKTETIISNIRKEFTTINAKQSSYQMKESEVEGLSTEGGKIKKYYDSTVLKKAILTLYGESGQMIVEYYFSHNQLIFAFEKNESYDRLVHQGKVKVVSTTENRFYFDKQKLIRWIQDKKIMDKTLYAEREKEILADLAGDLMLIP
jgi:hypothetical protein